MMSFFNLSLLIFISNPISISQLEDYSVWLRISEDCSPRLKLGPDLPVISLGQREGVDGEDVGEEEEHLHVRQLSARAHPRPHAVGQEARLVRDELPVLGQEVGGVEDVGLGPELGAAVTRREVGQHEGVGGETVAGDGGLGQAGGQHVLILAVS